MLRSSNNGKIGFEPYTIDIIQENIGIEIVKDGHGEFYAYDIGNNGTCNVPTLYNILAAAISKRISAKIHEIASVLLSTVKSKKELSGSEEQFENDNLGKVLVIDHILGEDESLATNFYNSTQIYLINTLPPEVLSDIENRVSYQLENNNQHDKRPFKNSTLAMNKTLKEVIRYFHWRLFFPIIKSKKHLNFLDFLAWKSPRSQNFSWTGIAFCYLTQCHELGRNRNIYSENEDVNDNLWTEKLIQIEELTLGVTNSFLSTLYEKYENDWKSRLHRLLKMLPNLSEITLLNGFCDDDVICLIGQHCDRLKLKKIRICCEDFECTDPDRLTDDGLCEFIDRLSGSYSIEGHRNDTDVIPAALVHLDLGDCHYPNITSKTLSNLGKLKNLNKIDLRLLHLRWGEMFLEDNQTNEICRANILSLSVGQTNIYYQANIRENKGEEIIQRFKHVFKLFPLVEELHLVEIHADASAINIENFQKLGSLYQMAASLNLFDDTDKSTHKCATKSLHLNEAFFPISGFTYSEDGTKISKTMNFMKNVTKLHLQDFSVRSLMQIGILSKFENVTKLLISYGIGYTFIGTFPLRTTLQLIFENTKSIEDLQITQINVSEPTDARGALIDDAGLKSLIEDPENSRIRQNLRVFILSIDNNADTIDVRGYLRSSTRLGLSLEHSALMLQKLCPNIQRIGCLKSWSSSNNTNIDQSSDNYTKLIPLDSFLLPNFKLVKTSRKCECLQKFGKPCCTRVTNDLYHEKQS